MATLTLYSSVIPPYVSALQRISHFLTIGAAHAAGQGVAEAEAAEWRIAPDMYPLWMQVHIALQNARSAVERLGGEALPAWAAEERTFEALRGRLAKAVQFLESVDAAKWEGREAAERRVKINFYGEDVELGALDYVQKWAIPNMMFHTTTIYNIFRMKGAEIGKRDLLFGSDGL